MSATPSDQSPSAPPLAPELAGRLSRNDAGLVCAVIQQWDTREVLMVGWMDDEALHRTMTSGRVTFWSRSRQEYWRKGDTSGHVQWVKSMALDCDGDTLLVTVDQVGGACHTGDRTCFDADRLEVVTGPVPAPAGTAAPTGEPTSAVAAPMSAPTSPHPSGQIPTNEEFPA